MLTNFRMLGAYQHTIGIYANGVGEEFRGRLIGLAQRTWEGKAGMMMAEIVYTRLSGSGWGAGCKRKNLARLEWNRLTARGYTSA